MASDQVVLAKDVLDAICRVRRHGVEKLMQELERREPDLAEVVLEETSLLHRRLAARGISARDVRRVMHRIESLLLVAIGAVRRGYLRLCDAPIAGPDPADPRSSPDGTSPTPPPQLGPQAPSPPDVPSDS